MQTQPCPCGSKKYFSECCEPLHLGDSNAETAEALMRSRYSAYVKGNAAYLTNSWHHTTRPNDLALESTNWIGLKIKSTRQGSINDSEGWVEFVARYKVDGRAHRLQENSYFKKVDGVWFYVNAVD